MYLYFFKCACTMRMLWHAVPGVSSRQYWVILPHKISRGNQEVQNVQEEIAVSSTVPRTDPFPPVPHRITESSLSWGLSESLYAHQENRPYFPEPMSLRNFWLIMLRRSSYEILCYFLEVVTSKFFPGFFFSTGIRQRIPQYFKSKEAGEFFVASDYKCW